MFSRPLLSKVSVSNSTTTITLMYVLKARVIKVSVYNSTTSITTIYVLKANVIKLLSLQQYYYYHKNVCSRDHCYLNCEFTRVMLLSQECMFSRPLLLKVSVYNSTTTITRMYVLKVTVLKVSVYNSTTTISHECMFSKSLLLKSLSLQQYYYYHTNVCSQGHCYKKGQFTTLLLASHQCMFLRPLLLNISVYNNTTTITRMYLLKVTVIH